MDRPDRSYCAERVRRHDHDRYLTCLFAPADRREALFALYAFNLEIARTAEAVSDPLLGRVRLQWWRETVESVYAGQPPAHEVAAPLAAALRAHALDRGHFERLIAARETDLDPDRPDSLAALERYAEDSSVPLVLLALEILGQDKTEARRAARPIGIAWALTGLLRAVPAHARQKRLYLPKDLIVRSGLKLGDLFEVRPTSALTAVAAQIAARAGEHLRQAQALRARVPRAALPALLPATLAAGYLRALAKVGHDPFAPRVQRPDPGRAWRLAWAALRGRY